jgi:hypothetical protein
MSEAVKRQGEMLRFLCRAKPSAVKAVVKNASPQLVQTLCECCHNVLKGNVPLTAVQKRRLRRHKSSLRELTKKKLSVKRRKQILQQGGFIGLLLRPILNRLKVKGGLSVLPILNTLKGALGV